MELVEEEYEESMHKRAFYTILEKLEKNAIFWIQTCISRSSDTFCFIKAVGYICQTSETDFCFGTIFFGYAELVLLRWYNDHVSLREGGNTACLTRSKSIAPVRRNS